MKQAVKTSREQGAKVVSRQVPPEDTDRWTKKLQEIEDEIEEVLKEEKEERALSITERDLKRGENLIVHENEIKSRPKKTWFESERDKRSSREKGAVQLNGFSTKKDKRKLSGKDRKKLELNDVRSEGKMWKKGKGDRDTKPAKGKGKGTNDKSKPGKAGKPTRR